MPPKKKEATEGTVTLLKGFEDKETKLIAAAFLSSTGPDKYDYDLMSVLTGNTVGSLKKMWPPVKRKAIDANESFGKFLGLAGAMAAGETTASTVPKLATGGKKRKATSPDEEADEANDDSTEPAPADTTSDDNKSDSKKKAGPTEKKASTAKKPGRPRKQIKKEGNDDEVMADSGEQSADGGDGVDKDVTNGV